MNSQSNTLGELREKLCIIVGVLDLLSFFGRKYNTPTLFVFQEFLTIFLYYMDFALAIWYNIFEILKGVIKCRKKYY